MMLPPLKSADEYMLTLDVIPFIHPPQIASQRLIVSIDDLVVGVCDLSRPTLLGYRIPATVARGPERLVVTLRHPNAVRPVDVGASADGRDIAFALSQAKLCRVEDAGEMRRRRLPAGLMLGAGPEPDAAGGLTGWATDRTGLTLHDLAFRFESLGENCEFGLFQRRCDAEPLGLLRFSSTFMRNLIRGVESGFADIGANEDIEPRLEGEARKEFMIHERKYGLVYHSFVFEGERSVWLMREQEAARLKFLRRKFIEELEAAEKIFVYRHRAETTLEEILPLYMALTRYGPATLLWVVPAVPGQPAGAIEVLMPGLMKGYIDRFAPEDNAHDLSFDGWLRLCANACVMQRLQQELDRQTPAAGAQF